MAKCFLRFCVFSVSRNSQHVTVQIMKIWKLEQGNLELFPYLHV